MPATETLPHSDLPPAESRPADSYAADLQPSTSRLHPKIYLAIVVLFAWMVAVITGFIGNGYTGLVFTVITGLALMATLLPLALWRLWRHDHAAEARTGTLRNWLAGDLETWQSRLSGKESMVEILTVPAAAALGMTVLMIVYHLDKLGAI
ncbi:MAG TPA: hypothetical protein VMF53_04800 [Alphaproteobacteria bacterium]|nr:hypothetical protein [Alphaproteobacteria bacterium]